MSTEKTSIPLDRVALKLSLAGVLLGIAVAMVGRIYEQNFTMHGYGVFVAFSIAAIVLGAITGSSVIGKTAPITSSILQFGSIGMLGLGVCTAVNQTVRYFRTSSKKPTDNRFNRSRGPRGL